MRKAMKRALFLPFAPFVLLAASACGSAPPPVAAPPPAPDSPLRLGKSVQLPSGTNGYLALPTGTGQHPAVIVVHEWWGLNDRTRDDTDRLAYRGYVALAVDLYRGKVTISPDVAHELMRGLPEDRALGDLEGAFAWLSTRPDVDPSKIGVVGWCMGGGYALNLAVDQPKLRAAVINYGRLVTSPDKVAKIKAAFLGNFAGQDQGIQPADVQAFQKQLQQTDSDVDIKIYPDDGHAFMNPGNLKGYDEVAAKDAWTRIEAFFARTLKGGAAATPR
jgi:carboxymethylenebutenolidase